jgi:hypothetical protein
MLKCPYEQGQFANYVLLDMEKILEELIKEFQETGLPGFFPNFAPLRRTSPNRIC